MSYKFLGFICLLVFNLFSVAKRPNIVFILADDLGYGDIKAFGEEKSKVPTPHFDQLCRDGMKFTNAHVTNSVCVPSRTSIMTGPLCLSFQKRRARRTMGIYWSSVSHDSIYFGRLVSIGWLPNRVCGEVASRYTHDHKRRENPGPCQY
jgi:hypothetical protein